MRKTKSDDSFQQIEQALRESEERLQSILSSIDEVVWSAAPDGMRIHYINPAVEHIWGLPVDDFYANAWPLAEVIHPEDRARIEKSFRVLIDGGDFDTEYRIVRPDGETRWIHDRGRRVVGENGQSVTLTGIAADVTRRKQAEELLIASQDKIAGIINSAMDALITVDADQRITVFNSAAERMFGYSAGEAIGRPVDRFIPERFRSAHWEHVRDFGKTDITKRSMGALGFIYGLHANGAEFPIEASISQLEIRGQKLYTVILRDITARKKTEERLREQAALLNQTQEAIIVNDLEGHILFWNRGAESLYGWMAEEVIGGSLAGQAYRDEESHKNAAQILFSKGVWKGELRQYAKDGREIIVEGHWTLINDDEGKPKSILIVNHDVTEKKKIESQFLRAQRLESIGTLASGIAHDLNNVLTPIMMALQILEMRFTDENSRRMLEVLRQSAERGGEMVQQVLSFARGVEGQKVAIQPTYFIKEILKVLRETLPKNITVKQSLPPDIGAVNGDATQLHQVLMNLCVNARDAMPDGGSLTIGAENTVIDEHYARMVPDANAGRYVMITVSDTGAGIPEHIKDKIFDPFFTTKEKGKGTGLGLSTVIGIVKSLGGFINVYSEVGKGAKFKIYLPMVETANAAETAADQTGLPLGNGELILVVDDEAGIRDIAKTTLETFGYRVLTAEDGTEAVAIYASRLGEVQAVLTDMMMPFMDGAATIRALQKLDPQVRIIASTGLSDGLRSEDTEKLGAKLVLSKPYTAETLLKALAASLDYEAAGKQTAAAITVGL